MHCFSALGVDQLDQMKYLNKKFVAMGDLEYTPHPQATLLGEEEEDNTREIQELSLKVPTSRGSESPISTPLVGISYLTVQLSQRPHTLLSTCPASVDNSLITERGEVPDPIMVLLQYVPRLQGEKERV